MTLTGPEPAATTDIAEDSIRLVYTYSADDLHGRMLTGSIEVAAAVDGVAVSPTININGARGEITIVLERDAYPNPAGHLLAVTLSLSAAADGFALGEPSSIATPFSFLAEVVPDTVVTLTGPEPAATTDIAEDSIRLVYAYSADDLRGRMLTGSIEVAAAVDGVAVTPTININGARGEITIVLEREAYTRSRQSLACGDPEPQRGGRGRRLCLGRAELDRHAVQLPGRGCPRHGRDPDRARTGGDNRHRRGQHPLGLCLQRRRPARPRARRAISRWRRRSMAMRSPRPSISMEPEAKSP